MSLANLTAPQREALKQFLTELCGYATHQFGDKAGEWGIEEFCFDKLKLVDPDRLSDDDRDEADDVLFEMRKDIIDEFEAIFAAGLKARWP